MAGGRLRADQVGGRLRGLRAVRPQADRGSRPRGGRHRCSRSPKAARPRSSSARRGRASRPARRVFFVYNNPDDDLAAPVRRSREVLDDPRIEKVNLTTGPMAITGSTRMQATSIELLAMLTVLEMVLRELVGDGGPAGAGVGRPDGRRRRRSRAALVELHGALQGRRGPRPARRPRRDAEERIYRRGRPHLVLRPHAGGGRPHRHDRAQPHVLYALVPQVGRHARRPSRGPSCSPPSRRPRRRGRRSCAVEPQTIEWTAEDLRDAAGRRGGRSPGGGAARDRPRRTAALPHRPRRPRPPADPPRRRRDGGRVRRRTCRWSQAGAPFTRAPAGGRERAPTRR